MGGIGGSEADTFLLDVEGVIVPVGEAALLAGRQEGVDAKCSEANVSELEDVLAVLGWGDSNEVPMVSS